ncbi:hypothetical protein FSP39_006342 [Pinctada imbricata]|uniref:Uncharacterized protein n=1 Tax=Pinctada imbricata TaxID=66713 RepID=A0AA88XRY0_PINIB|nr:hypothetical protein FSP39_006342 [Pinctada imbricata]
MWSISGRGGVPLQLTKNGVVIGRSDPSTGTEDDFGNVSGFVITYAEENDVLLMKTHSTVKALGKIYSNEYHQSAFGGWRLG